MGILRLFQDIQDRSYAWGYRLGTRLVQAIFQEGVSK